MTKFWNGFQISVHCANLCMIFHNHHGDSHANQDVLMSTSGVYLRFHLTYADCINTLRPRQNGRLFADDTFKCIFLNENV